jgi:methyltransferase family protein
VGFTGDGGHPVEGSLPGVSAPARSRLRRIVDRLLGAGRERRCVFRRIWLENAWGSEESRSGPGSGLARTQSLREALPAVLSEHGVRVLLDAPCGDFHWMRHLRYDLERYVGVDVVPEAIEAARRAAAPFPAEFRVADVVKDALPAADAVLCRDALVHLPLRDAVRAIANFRRSGARVLLATTFPATPANDDCRTGSWRPRDLSKPPFDLGPPRQTLFDASPDRPDKVLGVWLLSAPGGGVQRPEVQAG